MFVALVCFGCVESPKNISSNPESNSESRRQFVPEPDVLLRLSGQFTMIENASVSQKLISIEYYTVGSSQELLKMDKWPEEYSTIYTIHRRQS